MTAPQTYIIAVEDGPRFPMTAPIADVLAETERLYCIAAGDPQDDPDYVRPDTLWRLDWAGQSRTVLRLHADGKPTRWAINLDGKAGA